MRTYLKGALVGAVAATLINLAAGAIAGTGVGGVFNLGQLNTVDAETRLTGNSSSQMLFLGNSNSTSFGRALTALNQSRSGAAIRAENKGGGPGLSAVTGGAAPPFIVDSSLKVSMLNADLLDGVDSSGFLPAGGTAANANALGGLVPASYMRAPTKWKQISTLGQRYPHEIGEPTCSGDRDCYYELRCNTGDVLLSGGFDSIDNGTRLIGAYPFNANGYDHKYTLVWHNNGTADTVQLKILCADQ